MSISDWSQSRPHLDLLSKFLTPRVPETIYATPAHRQIWQHLLGESPEDVIHQFENEGVLGRPGLEGFIEAALTVSEIQKILRANGLPVSGSKDVLIHRLVEQAPDQARSEVVGVAALQCCAEGRALAHGYVSAERARRTQADRQTLTYVQQRQLAEASRTVAAFEAASVWSRGIGMGTDDWTHHDTEIDVVVLRSIFTVTPETALYSAKSQSEVLREAAAMAYLWDTKDARAWLPAGFLTKLTMDSDTSARMLVLADRHQEALSQYKEGMKDGSIVAVGISAANDSCSACQKLAGKQFQLRTLPHLPYKHCTHPNGCRCAYVPITPS